ncbi:hypothetical protein [Brucella intermedia]|uniref:hypothetical protein n=1 Tax=Brucella intermedia TaxID=94625 RepID=UPI001590C85B|nr:hypothetical protein [Brucella intermedia]
MKDQAKNRSATKLYNYEGQMLHLREISEQTGISYDALRDRITRRGMSLTDAISLPVKQGVRRSGYRPAYLYQFKGEERTISEIAEIVGMNKHTLKYRLKSGRSLQDAIKRSEIP